jgi:hypothetical protein
MKTKAEYGELSTAVLKALKEYGPMTRAEIEVLIKQSKERISNVVSRLNKQAPRVGKQIHIVRWVHDSEGARPYPRAVYALGDGQDTPKPKPQKRIEIRRRYDEKRRNRYSMNSVFNLALTRDQIRAQLKAATA